MTEVLTLHLQDSEAEVRVREIIKGLSHSDLVRTGVIPDLLKFTPFLETKRYPPWVYKQSKTDEHMFSKFGLFMEQIIIEAILSKNSHLDNDRLNSHWKTIFSTDPPAELFKSRNFFVGIYNTFRPVFENHQNIQHEPELTNDFFCGHPDIFNPEWILDVKTTNNFSKMAEESFLQILSYAVLARQNGYLIQNIGILLPLQRQILWYNISQWDGSHFLQVLIQHSQWVQSDFLAMDSLFCLAQIASIRPEVLNEKPFVSVVNGIGYLIQSKYLGSHIPKNIDFPKHIPIQIYLAGRQPGEEQGYISEIEIEHLTQKCQNVTIYIHAPNNINSSADHYWLNDQIKDQLRVGQRIGAKGVVVHVGKYKDEPIPIARQRMINRLRFCSNFATESCPILIETPAGQKSELFPVLEEFLHFYSEFNEIERTKIKICIDTCHVFAAGYDPEFYLKTWLNYYPRSVGLVHFNDSEKPRGSHVDRHAPAGLGYIGYIRLWNVHQLCVEEGISMVTE